MPTAAYELRVRVCSCSCERISLWEPATYQHTPRMYLHMGHILCSNDDVSALRSISRALNSTCECATYHTIRERYKRTRVKGKAIFTYTNTHPHLGYPWSEHHRRWRLQYICQGHPSHVPHIVSSFHKRVWFHNAQQLRNNIMVVVEDGITGGEWPSQEPGQRRFIPLLRAQCSLPTTLRCQTCFFT
jgi:hypothetical protein